MASKQLLSAYRCGCEVCVAGTDLEVRAAHERINLLLTRLDEQQRRWYVATLAEQFGLRKGGVRIMTKITGMSEKTIRKGLIELSGGLGCLPVGRLRQAGAGRPPKIRPTPHEWDG